MIDRFLNGVATSSKSFNLTLKSYQDIGRFGSMLRGFVDKLSSFQGGKLSGLVVEGKDITTRVLELVIQRNALTVAQANAIAEAAKYAQQHGVFIRGHRGELSGNQNLSAMMRKTRSAGVYARGDKLFTYPYSKTTAGVYITGEPVVVVPCTTSNKRLGEVVAEALRGYKTDVPHPHYFDLNRRTDPILEAAKIKSWSSFSRGALYCSISEVASELRVTPSRKTNSRGASVFIPEHEVKLELPVSPEQLGLAVREALSRCE